MKLVRKLDVFFAHMPKGIPWAKWRVFKTECLHASFGDLHEIKAFE